VKNKMHDPASIAWVRIQFEGGQVQLDPEDYEPVPLWGKSDAEAAHLYQLAQANKLIRMYGEWKASQN
jgi:hypothetical protein